MPGAPGKTPGLAEIIRGTAGVVQSPARRAGSFRETGATGAGAIVRRPRGPKPADGGAADDSACIGCGYREACGLQEHVQ